MTDGFRDMFAVSVEPRGVELAKRLLAESQDD